MELRHLRYVLAVAESGSLGAASRVLHMAKQPLSVQIADVERELGTPLFERRPTGMVCTEAGLEFVAYARATLATHARMVARMRRSGRAGTPLRIVPPGVQVYDTLLTRALARLARTTDADDAASRVTLHPLPLGRHLRAVRDGEADVALHLGVAGDLAVIAPGRPTSVAPDRELEGTLLESLGIEGAIVPVSHALALRTAVEPAELGTLALLALPVAERRVAYDEGWRRLELEGWRPRRPTVEVYSHAEAIHRFASGDVWAGAAPDVARRPPPGMVYRPFAAGGTSPWSLLVVTRLGDADAGEGDPRVLRLLAALRAEREAHRRAPDRLPADGHDRDGDTGDTSDTGDRTG